ncbi:MAG TPA: hypothetical protein VGY31_03305, partial [Terriglobia bacterium]|nr:hypothetical protein [Terriglobia bacterium]
EHPEVERLGYPGVEEVKRMVAERKITDMVAAAHLAHVGRVIKDRAKGIMVSKWIPPDVQRHIGFEPASTPQEALGLALAASGPGSSVVVLRQGGHVLPLVAGASASVQSS